MGTSLPGTGTLAGWYGVGLGPLAPQGNLLSQDIPPDFSYAGMGPAQSVSLPLLPVKCGFFCICLVIGLLFS